MGMKGHDANTPDLMIVSDLGHPCVLSPQMMLLGLNDKSPLMQFAKANITCGGFGWLIVNRLSLQECIE